MSFSWYESSTTFHTCTCVVSNEKNVMWGNHAIIKKIKLYTRTHMYNYCVCMYMCLWFIQVCKVYVYVHVQCMIDSILYCTSGLFYVHIIFVYRASIRNLYWQKTLTTCNFLLSVFYMYENYFKKLNSIKRRNKPNLSIAHMQVHTIAIALNSRSTVGAIR